VEAGLQLHGTSGVVVTVKQTSRSSLGRAPVLGLALSVALVLTGFVASSASALTEVWLNNQTSVPFTEESLCITVDEISPCPEDWREGFVLSAGQSNPGIELDLQVVGAVPAHLQDSWSPGGLPGNLKFEAIDPVFGPTAVECWSEEMPGFSCSVVHGLFAYIQRSTSSTELLGAVPSADARFWSGVAPVGKGGTALVPVASYSGQRGGKVRERVVLRGGAGKVIGSGEKTVQFGRRTSIGVHLTAGVARMVARGEDITVRASVTHADATEGTGQATTLALTKLTSDLSACCTKQ
jgi:hypothetical protein